MNLYHHRRLLLEIQTPPPPPPRQHGSRVANFTSDANFDTNMVIILAALLCSLICAVGLNSIMRCVMRCTRQVGLEAADESSLASNGLKKCMMSQIPVAEYGAGMNIPTTECPICLGEFLDGEKVRVLPKCHHGFHVRCIDIWLACHSSCPTCRQSLLEQPPAAATNAAVDGEMLGSVEE